MPPCNILFTISTSYLFFISFFLLIISSFFSPYLVVAEYINNITTILDLPRIRRGQRLVKASLLSPTTAQGVVQDSLNIGKKPIGISFTRTFDTKNQGDENDIMFNIKFDKGKCLKSDENGDNACHYDWGDTIHAYPTLSLNSTASSKILLLSSPLLSSSSRQQQQERQRQQQHITEPFNSNDTIEGSFRIDRFVKWDFTCAPCGSDCSLKLPVVKRNVRFEMPDCPLDGTNFPLVVQVELDNTSPTNGRITTNLNGEVRLRKENGEVIIRAAIKITVK